MKQKMLAAFNFDLQRTIPARSDNCSLGKLVRLVSGLGLSLSGSGWHPVQALGRDTERPDFGVRAERIISAMGEPS